MELHIYPSVDGTDSFPEELPALWRTGAPLGDPEAFRAMWQDEDDVVHGSFVDALSEDAAVQIMAQTLGSDLQPVYH